jgi:hypothetical protein
MMKFDKVVQDIKTYWLAAHKTAKEVKFEYARYYPASKTSTIKVLWLEHNPERIAEQIHDLIEGGKKFGLQWVDKEFVTVFPPSEDFSETMYSCSVMLNYKEEF